MGIVAASSCITYTACEACAQPILLSVSYTFEFADGAKETRIVVGIIASLKQKGNENAAHCQIFEIPCGFVRENLFVFVNFCVKSSTYFAFTCRN